MLNVTFYFWYNECRYGECRYAECHGAQLTQKMAPVGNNVFGIVLQRDGVHGPLGLVAVAGGVVDDQGIAAGLVRLPPEELL